MLIDLLHDVISVTAVGDAALGVPRDILHSQRDVEDAVPYIMINFDLSEVLT